MVQWFSVLPTHAGGMGLIPGRGANISEAVHHRPPPKEKDRWPITASVTIMGSWNEGLTAEEGGSKLWHILQSSDAGWPCAPMAP